ncbi:hypothetical protein [Orrella marina]|nr:hypothetical protein [Orrella marina]
MQTSRLVDRGLRVRHLPGQGTIISQAGLQAHWDLPCASAKVYDHYLE